MSHIFLFFIVGVGHATHIWVHWTLTEWVAGLNSALHALRYWRKMTSMIKVIKDQWLCCAGAVKMATKISGNLRHHLTLFVLIYFLSAETGTYPITGSAGHKFHQQFTYNYLSKMNLNLECVSWMLRLMMLWKENEICLNKETRGFSNLNGPDWCFFASS